MIPSSSAKLRVLEAASFGFEAAAAENAVKTVRLRTGENRGNCQMCSSENPNGILSKLILCCCFLKIKTIHVNLLESKHITEIDETRTFVFDYIDNKLFKTNLGIHANLI